jgi:hypothetical protein
VSKNILPHMILPKNILPQWMDLSRNVLMMCDEYALEFIFLFTFTCSCSQNSSLGWARLPKTTNDHQLVENSQINEIFSQLMTL